MSYLLLGCFDRRVHILLVALVTLALLLLLFFVGWCAKQGAHEAANNLDS